jgi:hypothetical protein
MLSSFPDSSYRFVRSSIINLLPGKPLACSTGVFPTPPTNTGLQISTTSAVQFGNNIVYTCTNSSLVTNDGFSFNLRCMTSGQAQARVWQACRARSVSLECSHALRCSSILVNKTCSCLTL